MKFFLFESGKQRRLFFELSVGFLRFFLSLEVGLVDIVLQTLGLELQLVILRLQHTLRRPLLFNLFGMLDKQIVLLHFGQVPLFPNLHELGVEVRNAPFRFVHVATQFADLLLVAALFKLQVERMVLLAELLHFGLVTTAQIPHELLVLVAGTL